MVLVIRSALICIALAGAVRAQSTTRATVNTAGVQGNDVSGLSAISADGRYVAFDSRATNLVPGDTNGTWDVFVRDRQTGITTRASVDSGGVQRNRHSWYPSISADGRHVGFASENENLSADAFVHDRLTGQTTRVSVNSLGTPADDWSEPSAISADGRFVAFHSLATNLGAAGADTGGFWDVFVHDRQTGQTTCVSRDPLGAESDSDSWNATISGDGRWVCFYGSASTLVAGDTNGHSDVFVHDRQSGSTARVSVSSTGAQGDVAAEVGSISADGRHVAFGSYATNIVPGDTNSEWDVFVHDRQTGQTARVSLDSAGAQANGRSQWPAISADGRHVAFPSDAPNLVAGDTNAYRDIFVHDRQTGQTTRASLGAGGAQGNANSDLTPAVSGDGTCVAFWSEASNLVAGDTNATVDVFVRDEIVPGSAFCIGDGTGAACPCANESPVGVDAGCASSLGLGGSLTARGTASLNADTAVLSGFGMPSSYALYFQGTTAENGGSGSWFGDGLQCAAGSVTRLGTKLNSGGASQYPAAGDVPLSVRGLVTTPGTRTYQVWYRNAADYCTPSTFNLTNGWEIAWSS